MRTRVFAPVVLCGLLSSCSFNNQFLHPTRLPPGLKQITLRDPVTNDTTLVTVHGQNLQPVFLKNGRDTVQLDFTIKGAVFESANGNKLNGWLLAPKGATPDITLLHLHGNAGFLLSQYGAISPLLKHGFQVFLFDYSGFGFSTGEATRENVLTDAYSALDYLANRPEVKNTKLLLYGQSLGGHLAATVAGNRESLIDGVVIEGAFSSHKDAAADRAGFLGRLLVAEQYSGKDSLRNYRKPLLVIHSRHDEVVPMYLGRKLYEAGNPPKEFYEIEKCHICGPKYYAPDIAHKIRAMLQL